MAGQYSNSSSGSASGSHSGPVAVQTPQSEWELQLAQLLDNMGQNQYNWASNQFNNAQGVTDAQINNYLAASQQGMNQASNLWGRYQSVYEPLSNEWNQEAGSYASTPRINFNMGAAQSAAGQAADQGMANATQQLQSYGIDPSSGRYAELNQAAEAQRAASQAGAGQQAELSTEQTGRGMLQTAIAQGQALPGDTVNALNSAYQGIAGAENSALGLENTGVNLMDSASPYFNAAMNMKLPGVGNASTSGQASSSGSQSSPAAPQQNGGGGGGGSGPNPSNNGGNYGYVPNSGMAAPDTGGVNPVDVPSGGGYADSGGGLDSGAYGSGSFSAGYAGGGEAGQGVISGPTTGGFVPQSASPSQGQQTDDISARLNAREFVIPQDVTDWKGQEFFQKLISQSREARMKGQQSGQMAQGQQKPALSGPPSFVSKRMQPAHAMGGVI